MQYLTKKTLVILAVLCIPGAWTFGLVHIAPAPAVAAAEGIEGKCPNKAYRTGPSANLPDCRAYELVTPSEKDSSKIYFTGVGSDEETVTLTSLAGFGGVAGGEGLPGFVYVDVRSSKGWESLPVVPSAARFVDLNAGGVTGRTGPVAGQSSDGHDTLWLLHEFGQSDNTAGFYLTGLDGVPVELGPALPPDAESVFHAKGSASAPVEVEGVSADASRVVFRLVRKPGEELHEWAFSEPGVGGPEALLEYMGTRNTSPVPVGVDDEGKAVEACHSQVLGGQLHSESIENSSAGWSHNAISSLSEGENGRVIFFTDMCPGTHQIFARVGSGESGAYTVDVSEPSRAACSACVLFGGEPEKRPAAYFVGASRDGSRVFFTTSQPLLGGDSSENLYEYDFGTSDRVVPEGEHLVRVSGGDGTEPSVPADVEGVIQVSEDGSHVYFVAGGVLTENPNDRGETANNGSNNLYVFDAEDDRISFIVSLPASDARLWRGNENLPFPQGSAVTPDGRFLVFTSHGRLTSDDSSTASQVFEYDALSGLLVRVSVGEDGFNDDGNTFLGPKPPPRGDVGLEDPNDARLPEQGSFYDGEYSGEAYFKELAVSADGAYVFFESSDGLTPQALNHVVIHPLDGSQPEEEFGSLYAENVYEYHEGNVYLITDGRDVAPSLAGSYVSLLGTDPSGRDVFFTTTDRLSPQDTDSQVDIYDARIDGGFPGLEEPAGCEGDACQGALSPSPVLLSPGSEFQAGGNSPLAAPAPAVAKAKPKTKKKPKKCKKGETRRHGECAKPKARKSDRRRKS